MRPYTSGDRTAPAAARIPRCARRTSSALRNDLYGAVAQGTADRDCRVPNPIPLAAIGARHFRTGTRESNSTALTTRMPASFRRRIRPLRSAIVGPHPRLLFPGTRPEEKVLQISNPDEIDIDRKALDFVSRLIDSVRALSPRPFHLAPTSDDPAAPWEQLCWPRWRRLALSAATRSRTVISIMGLRDGRYSEIFRRFNLDVEAGSVDEAGARFRHVPLCWKSAFFLDVWAK